MPEKILKFKKRMGGEDFLGGVDWLFLKSQIEIFRALLRACFSEEEVREVLRNFLKWAFRRFNERKKSMGEEEEKCFQRIFSEIEKLCFDFKAGFFAPPELPRRSGAQSRYSTNASL